MNYYQNISLTNLFTEIDGEIIIEEWADIRGFEGEYQISTFGRVKSIGRFQEIKNRWGGLMNRYIKEKIKMQRFSKSGYLIIDLNRNKQPETQIVHILVATAFIDNSKNKPTVNHISGIKTNNSIKNLEWATWNEQAAHARLLGLYNDNGSNSVNSKLNEDKVKEIRNRYQFKKVGSYILAKEYDVCQSVILAIIHRKIWKHV